MYTLPVFSTSGLDAELYGAAEGYPIADPPTARCPYEWDKPKYRIGSYSHFDQIYPTRRVERAAVPWAFRRAQEKIEYWHWGARSSISEYLSRTPTTGLLIAKGDEIVVEHYQYGRTDRDRFNSMSVSKTITAMLIGIAISEERIGSVEDTAERYVPGFKDTEYGRTSIRDLLHMSSGVEFGEAKENEGGNCDVNRLFEDMVLDSEKSTITSILQFNKRIAAPGTRFYYASIESDVLGFVLRYAVGKPISDYLREKIWEPIGAESDASWLIDTHGFEVAHGFFSAVLRDYARLGRLLADDGAWHGRQIIPRQWIIDATTVRASDAYLAAGKAYSLFPPLGYGYQVWLLPGKRRSFVLNGVRGQNIFVDPGSKLVMVNTAVDWSAEPWLLWSALLRQFADE